MSDQLAVLKLVATRFDAAGIPYMITGSIASSYYAEPRFTRDIDVVVEFERDDVARIVELFADVFFVEESAVARAVDRRGLVNLIHQDLLVKVDLIVRKDGAYRLEEFRRRRLTVIDEVPVQMVAPEDLVLSKLVWMKESQSDLQRRDVEAVVGTTPDLDREYIERWAQELTVMALWRDVTA